MSFNPLIPILKQQSNGPFYSNTRLVHWPLMGGLLHLVQRGWAWAGWAPPSPLLAVPNVTAHPSTASVPTKYYLMWYCNCLWTLNIDVSYVYGRHGTGEAAASHWWGNWEWWWEWCWRLAVSGLVAVCQSTPAAHSRARLQCFSCWVG